MTNIAIPCSGQGTQTPGMFDLLANAPEADPVFEAAKAALGGMDPRDLVRQTSETDLHANKMGQILCCTQAMAAWAVLRGLVSAPFLTAGYSVGELAAWGIAGMFSADEVLRLAARRASLMDEATKEPSGLLAVRGLARHALELLCAKHGCAVAIVNAPERILVGGTRPSLEALASDAQAQGAFTRDVGVTVAAHTPALRGAGEQFRDVLRQAGIAESLPSELRLLSGIDGSAVFDLRDGMDKLARQIGQTIDWAACMDACRSSGVIKVLELGPGDALARLMQPVMPDSDTHSLSQFRSLEGLKSWLNSKRSG